MKKKTLAIATIIFGISGYFTLRGGRKGEAPELVPLPNPEILKAAFPQPQDIPEEVKKTLELSSAELKEKLIPILQRMPEEFRKAQQQMRQSEELVKQLSKLTHKEESR